MKKLFIGALIALTTISFVSCGNDTQSSNNTANPVQNAEEEAVTQSESVLYSDDNITVTTTGFEFDEMWDSYFFNVTVENHSDKNLAVTFENTSIGSEMSTCCSFAHTKAGKQDTEGFIFEDVSEYTSLEGNIVVFEYPDEDENDLTQIYSAPISYTQQ